MSRLCRLRTKSHGPDGQWAYNEIISLRTQLKGAQTAAEYNFQQYQDAGRLLYEAHEQLAASQAREQQLREALTCCVCAMQDYQAGIGITEMFDKGERLGRLALQSITQDTTALEALIAKAVELMRERCRSVAFEMAYAYSMAVNVSQTIRALPGVTLDDLKGGAA